MQPDKPLQARVRGIVAGLARLYPDARCSLDHATPVQLLLATILSAQCTDARVNLVTPALFARYPDAAAFADADVEEVEQLIKSTGFYHNKAKNIVRCCQQLMESHQGVVPNTMEELVALAGVGRKTANVILGNAFGIPGLPVDTHVGRLSQRMGLTTATDPQRIEQDLGALLPRNEWTLFGLRMIYHGRAVCSARKPDCAGCELSRLCPKVGVSEPENGPD